MSAVEPPHPAPLAIGPGALEPALRIIDPHHHLWHAHAHRYFADAFHADITASGHDVAATVYVECSAFDRSEGPSHLRSAGEAEFAAGMAAMSESGAFGPARVCAGFVGAADLMLGDRLDEALDALMQASGGRLRGVRGAANWDPDPSVNMGTRPFAPRGLLLDERWRAGVRRLAQRGLVYDAWQYHPQLGDVCALADAAPETTIVVNHCGGLLGVGRYAQAGAFDAWRAQVADVARRPNTLMKLGGLAGRRCGFGYAALATRPDLERLAADWRPYIETCIELFGADRCMFESNFPVDKVAADYGLLWNVFKTIARNASADEKRALFAGTAAATYRLDCEGAAPAADRSEPA